MTTITYNAIYYQGTTGINGIAMRTTDQRVFFIDDKTQQWRELTDADAPNLQLCGRRDLALQAEVKDGNLVLRTSRTLQAA
jgi:hypothetical protein